MALVYVSQEDPKVQMAHPEVDPYTASAKDAFFILDELIKTGSPILNTK
jgi:hypothetical protein